MPVSTLKNYQRRLEETESKMHLLELVLQLKGTMLKNWSKNIKRVGGISTNNPAAYVLVSLGFHKTFVCVRTLWWTLYGRFRSNYGNLYVWQWRLPQTVRWHTCTTHCIIIVTTDIWKRTRFQYERVNFSLLGMFMRNYYNPHHHPPRAKTRTPTPHPLFSQFPPYSNFLVSLGFHKTFVCVRTLSWRLCGRLRSNYGNLYVWQWRPPLTARWHTCITHYTIKIHTDREKDQTSGRKGPIAGFCLCLSRNTFDWCYSNQIFR